MTQEPKTDLPPSNLMGLKDNPQKWAERWLSPERFKPYLDATNNNVKQAIELYEWNISLGQVLMRDISHFEVALRNSYDQVMREHWQNGHWLLNEGSPVLQPIIRMSKYGKPRDVNLVNRRAIAEARTNAHDRNDPNQVIANLMLGFWVHLTDRSRERDIWIPFLNSAWPKGTNRNNLNHSLTAINQLRNRVAHNERLFHPVTDTLSPAHVDADILNAFRILCPEAAEQLYGNSQLTSVEQFCNKYPSPVNVRL